MQNIDKWVCENTVDKMIPKKLYSKGWWEYIEFIRMLSSKFKSEAFVVDSYDINTPPPEEIITMPLVCIKIEDITFYIKQDFSYSGFHDAIVVSVVLENSLVEKLHKYINNIYFDEKFINKMVKPLVDNKIMFENYKSNKMKFTGTVDSEFDLYTLIKVCISSTKNK